MTDKEILKAFQEQFQTGRLFTESNVLVLMGMARGEERRKFLNIKYYEKPSYCNFNGPCLYQLCRTGDYGCCEHDERLIKI